VLKRGLLTAAVTALIMPTSAVAATTLMPGVTYTRDVRAVSGRAVVLHVMRMPRHGGLYGLRPVLSNNTVLGRETLPVMQRRVAGVGTVVGVNGDLFKPDTGQPTGVFLRDGVLATRPVPRRSMLGIAFDGRLVVDRLRFAGSWKVAGLEAHPLEDVNRPLADPPGVGLFTPQWNARTPRYPTAKEVVLTGFPRLLTNGWLTGTVATIRRGGGSVVPRGAAILHARGFWARILAREARPGTQVTVRVQLRDLPADVADAIGGGPVLVRNGQAVLRPDESFAPSHMNVRHPRTAVGQRADGRLIFLVAEGRSSRSAGLTHAQLARQMVRLGAVTAVGMDGGGSSTMAFEGRVLNRPSEGALRPVANGLFFYYYGIFAPRPRRAVISPNGDRVADSQVLTARVVRRSSVDLRLVRPNGTIAWRFRDVVAPQRLSRRVGTRGMAEGTWRWVVEATRVQNGRESRMARAFIVNRTLGHLRLSKERMRVVSGKGGRLAIAVNVTRRANVNVSVRSASGRVIRVLQRGEIGRGGHAWRWAGRNALRKVVPSGTYTVRVTARNTLGTVALAKAVRVVRT